MPGEFLRGPTGIRRFEQILHRLDKLTELDPKQAHESATPGVIGGLTDMMGAWRGREELRFEIPGVTQGARVIGPDERMEAGEDETGHIVARRGLELAGYSMRVSKHDFDYGGMDASVAAEMARKPLLNYNEEVSKIMLDVMTSGDYSGAVANNFAWSANDLRGNSASQPIATQDADQVANVYANDSQTFQFWPLRDGTQAAAGHDHIFDTGAAWTAASAKTQADNILEHPGANRVVAYVGSTVAGDVHDDLKTEYANNGPLQGFVEGDASLLGASFAGANRIGVRGGIDYWHMPDLPTSGALFVAAGSKPFHMSVGAVGASGESIDTGAWSEVGDSERGGITYGYRRFLSAGVKNPLAVSYGEFAA